MKKTVKVKGSMRKGKYVKPHTRTVEAAKPEDRSGAEFKKRSSDKDELSYEEFNQWVDWDLDSEEEMPEAVAKVDKHIRQKYGRTKYNEILGQIDEGVSPSYLHHTLKSSPKVLPRPKLVTLKDHNEHITELEQKKKALGRHNYNNFRDHQQLTDRIKEIKEKRDALIAERSRAKKPETTSRQFTVKKQGTVYGITLSPEDLAYVKKHKQLPSTVTTGSVTTAKPDLTDKTGKLMVHNTEMNKDLDEKARRHIAQSIANRKK